MKNRIALGIFALIGMSSLQGMGPAGSILTSAANYDAVPFSYSNDSLNSDNSASGASLLKEIVWKSKTCHACVLATCIFVPTLTFLSIVYVHTQNKDFE